MKVKRKDDRQGTYKGIEELNYGHLNTFPQFAYDSKAFFLHLNTIVDLKNDPHLEQLRLFLLLNQFLCFSLARAENLMIVNECQVSVKRRDEMTIKSMIKK